MKSKLIKCYIDTLSLESKTILLT